MMASASAMSKHPATAGSAGGIGVIALFYMMLEMGVVPLPESKTVSDLKTQVAVLSEGLIGARSEVDGIKVKVTHMGKELNDLKIEVTRSVGAVEALSGRLETAEAHIDQRIDSLAHTIEIGNDRILDRLSNRGKQ